MILERMGLSAWITDSEGTPLPEYKVKMIDDKTIECWIPSNEGTNFKIQWKALGNPQPGLDLQAITWLDGIQLYGQVARKNHIANGNICEKACEETGSSEARLLQFGKRELTDKDDGGQMNKTVLDHLNTIRLQLSWGSCGELVAPRTDFKEIKDIGPINERAAKKGHTGSAQLGRTIIAPASNRCMFHPHLKSKPVVFIFRYASRDWLQAREIIPYSPKPKLPSSRIEQKRSRSNSPDIIDIDDLESDDEVTVFKHMVPASDAPSKKKRRVEDEADVKPKVES